MLGVDGNPLKDAQSIYFRCRILIESHHFIGVSDRPNRLVNRDRIKNAARTSVPNSLFAIVRLAWLPSMMLWRTSYLKYCDSTVYPRAGGTDPSRENSQNRTILTIKICWWTG